MTAAMQTPGVEPSVELVTITPDEALIWLETCNTHNRSIRQDFVTKLAGAITRGEWIFNGDAIKFDTEDRLSDGQHRLWACVEAGIPIESTVVRGLDPAAQATMDTGRRRTLADNLRLAGTKAANQTAAALSVLWRLETGKILGSETPTYQEALELLGRNPGLPGVALRAETWRKHVGCSGAVLAAVYHRAQDIDANDADDFFSRLSSGADLPSDDPRFVFRRLTARKRSGRANEPQWQTHALLIKAWNAYRQGRKVTQLSFRPGGASPEKFPEMV